MIDQRVVSAILHDGAANVLLQQRDDKPGLAYAGFWTLFGGYVEEGETPEAAIVRELEEELGLRLPLTLWKAYECPVRTRPGEIVVTNHVYVGQVSVPLETLVLQEGQAMRYFTPALCRAMQLAFDQQVPLREYLDQEGEL